MTYAWATTGLGSIIISPLNFPSKCYYFLCQLLIFELPFNTINCVVITLKVGLTLPQLGKQANRQNLIKFSRKAEEYGFDSLWVLERLLSPINPQTPYPATPDGRLPSDYQTVLDPLETLSFVAANTEKISLGTSVIDMLFHNPVVLGRRFATLDVLSEGRTICGLAIGWSKDEYQASNIPFKNRGKRADEFLDALKSVWSDDVVEFKGEFYNIPASKIGPKPIQKPHIPIYLGGFSPNTFSRIVNYDANGWLGVPFGPLEQLKSTVNTIRNLAIKANKDPNAFKIILLTYLNISDTTNSSGKQRFPMSGTIEEIGNDIREIKDVGIEHVVFGNFFTTLYGNIDQTIETSKQLLQFAK
jgi:probable F420-dependent oxidoreductase